MAGTFRTLRTLIAGGGGLVNQTPTLRFGAFHKQGPKGQTKVYDDPYCLKTKPNIQGPEILEAVQLCLGKGGRRSAHAGTNRPELACGEINTT